MKRLFKKLSCWLFGHRINIFLIEYSKEKECMRCGKIVTVWWIPTVDEFLNNEK